MDRKIKFFHYFKIHNLHNKMATRGIKQLQKLRIVYCEYGGSSRYVREFLQKSAPTATTTHKHSIVQFALDNPTVEVLCQLRPGKHPYVRGEYLTGNFKQECIKNQPILEIRKAMQRLNNSSGRKLVKFEKPVVTQTPSVQGVWTPMLDICKEQWDVRIVS